jgi:hypothetical protein
MNAKRKIEIFGAGCPACEETISRIQDLACPDCEVVVLDMKDAGIAQRAKDFGVRPMTAIAIAGKLADCCSGRGPDEAVLPAAGFGQPLS